MGAGADTLNAGPGVPRGHHKPETEQLGTLRNANVDGSKRRLNAYRVSRARWPRPRAVGRSLENKWEPNAMSQAEEGQWPCGPNRVRVGEVIE